MLLLAFVFFTLACAQRGQKITSLPGWTGSDFPSMMGGYINLDDKDGKALYYILVHADDREDNQKPLAFWFQGGPGCSGLYALLTETGPLRMNGDGGVERSAVRFTDIFNVVYLEQPAGVGFSYSNNSAGYTTGDDQSAADNHRFVTKFLESYPEFKGRRSLIFGESYGGIYVPMLANAILSDPTSQAAQQLEGIMTGNPVFNCNSDINNTDIQVDLFYWHGLVSYEVYKDWLDSGCKGPNQNSQRCTDIFNRIYGEIGQVDQELFSTKVQNQPSLDPDCLYQDFCLDNGTLSLANQDNNNCDPIGNQETAYLRRPDVQSAIHVAPGLAPAPWSSCSNVISYSSNNPNMVPLYQNFSKQKGGKFKILVFSGDVDIATVPFATTQPCAHEISTTRKRNWGPWFVQGNTAGYYEEFDLHTYCTLKGGGHEASAFQPYASYHMFKRFINQGNLDEPSLLKKRRTMRKRVRTQGDVLRAFRKAQRAAGARK